MKQYLILLLVVGVLDSVAVGQDYNTGLGGEVYDANINQGGNNNYADYNEGGQAYDEYSTGSSGSSGSSDTDDASDEDNNDSQDPSSASNEEEAEYFFDGQLSTSAYRHGSGDVPFEAQVEGQVFLSKKDFKKLKKMQNSGENNAVQASAKGFAVATGKKDACAGIYEAMADLYFILPTFRMKFQGKVTFTSNDLEVMGGEDGLIKIIGGVSLQFRSETREKRGASVWAPNGYLYATK